MSYVRSRRSGLGQAVFAPTSQLPVISTSQPAAPAAAIPQPAVNRTPTKRLTVSVGGKTYPVCQDPASTKKDSWGWENGKSCKELNYQFCKSPIDTAGTGWGWEYGASCLVPISLSVPATPVQTKTPASQPASQPQSPYCGKPGYEAFTAENCAGYQGGPPAAPAKTTINIISEVLPFPPAGSAPGTVEMFNIGTGQKTVKGGEPSGPYFPSEDQGDGYDQSQGQGGGYVSLESFKASCAGLGGKMGTNCCSLPKSQLLPNGGVVGLVNGQMVQQVAGSCDSGSNLLLIGAAVVGVFLLSRML